MNNGKKNNLKIRDLPTASFLVATGHPISDVEREGRVCFFVFEDKEKTSEACKGFWSGTASVNAKAFSDATRNLKDLVFSIPS